MRSRRLTVALSMSLVLFAATFAQEQPQPFTPLFNGRNLDGWQVWSPKVNAAQFVAAKGVLRVTGGSGWLLTARPHGDFVLTFRARQEGKDSVGGVLVRALPESMAYEVQIVSGRHPSPLLVEHPSQTIVPVPNGRVQTYRADGRWHHYRVECHGDRVHMWRDGKEIVDVEGIRLDSGRIGLHGWRGIIEFRDIELSEAPPPPPFLLLYGVTAPYGSSAPRPIREVKPEYPLEAKRGGVVGEVRLQCIVNEDGYVEECAVLRQVSPELDAAALAAAKQWRFVPGTRDGWPTRVLVTLGMDFQLK